MKTSPVTATQAMKAVLFYSDSNTSVSATYYNNESVILVLPDKSQETLHLAKSGSGARYVHDTKE